MDTESARATIPDPPKTADTMSPPNEDDEEPKALSETLPPWKVLLVATGILMSLFLVALDRTIVSTVGLWWI